MIYTFCETNTKNINVKNDCQMSYLKLCLNAVIVKGL